MPDNQKPRKTLTVTRKRSTATNASEAEEGSAPLKLPTKKRVIKLDRPAKKPKQPPQPPSKKKKRVAPSVIRASELNKALSAHSKAWRSYSPLATDIEKQVFRFISERHLSASKRVVQALLKKHQRAKNYLLNSVMDAPIYDLSDNETGLVSWERASLAAKLLVKVEAQREAAKRAKRKK